MGTVCRGKRIASVVNSHGICVSENTSETVLKGWMDGYGSRVTITDRYGSSERFTERYGSRETFTDRSGSRERLHTDMVLVKR